MEENNSNEKTIVVESDMKRQENNESARTLLVSSGPEFMSRVAMVDNNQNSTTIVSSTSQNDIRVQDKVPTCKRCWMQFSSTTQLRSHRRARKGAAPQNCPHCHKWYCVASDFKKHLLRDHKDKTFSCEICEKSFVGKSGLTMHVRVVHEDKLYNCLKCDATFTNLTSFGVHMKLHFKDFPGYECMQCDEWFQSCTIFRRHLKSNKHLMRSAAATTSQGDTPTHQAGTSQQNAGDKHFKCFICNECFGSRDEVITHLESHNESVRSCIDIVPKEEPV